MKVVQAQEVMVKGSFCQKCGGWVRVAILHEMTIKSKNEFMREVMKHDLTVKTIPIADFRNSKTEMCECKY